MFSFGNGKPHSTASHDGTLLRVHGIPPRRAPLALPFLNRFEIETEIVVKAALANLQMVEVGSRELARRHGESNLRPFRDGFRVLRTLVVPRLFPGGRGALPQGNQAVRVA